MTKFMEKSFSVAVGSKEYRNNFDSIFGKKEKEICSESCADCGFSSSCHPDDPICKFCNGTGRVRVCNGDSDDCVCMDVPKKSLNKKTVHYYLPGNATNSEFTLCGVYAFNIKSPLNHEIQSTSTEKDVTCTQCCERLTDQGHK
jgi:hypothetical protein